MISACRNAVRTLPDPGASGLRQYEHAVSMKQACEPLRPAHLGCTQRDQDALVAWIFEYTERWRGGVG